jgi:membrane-bound lytic murein transglycosylase D
MIRNTCLLLLCTCMATSSACASEGLTIDGNSANSANSGNDTLPHGDGLPPTNQSRELPVTVFAPSGYVEGMGFENAKTSVRKDMGSDSDGNADSLFTDPDVQAIADRLAEDDKEESIRDAFVHGPEELDDLAVPVVFREAVDHYIAYFTISKRKMFASWLRRANQYAPLLRKILRDHDLPEDLVYLAMIESGFNPKAYSRAKASGPWQFISETGGRYGLRIDHWVDERRDFEKATVAAAQYLKDLFDRFGCWYLAASGYNAGEGRVERAIQRHNTSDYFQLYRYNTLPRETREYIPQLIAAATISENPEKYGFADTAPEATDEYRIKHVPGGTPLHLVADVSSTELSEIRSLNPELLTGITPPKSGQYALKLPEDTRLELFDEKLKSRLKGNRVVDTVRVSLNKRRSLTKTLQRYGATRGDLTLVNRGSISRGKEVYVPLFDRTRVKANAVTDARLSSYGKTKKSAGPSKKKLKKKGTPISHIRTVSYTKTRQADAKHIQGSRYGTKRKAIPSKVSRKGSEKRHTGNKSILKPTKNP